MVLILWPISGWVPEAVLMEPRWVRASPPPVLWHFMLFNQFSVSERSDGGPRTRHRPAVAADCSSVCAPLDRLLCCITSTLWATHSFTLVLQRCYWTAAHPMACVCLCVCRTVCTVPLIDYIDGNEYSMEPQQGGDEDGLARGAWDWSLLWKRVPLSQREKAKRAHTTQPYRYTHNAPAC